MKKLKARTIFLILGLIILMSISLFIWKHQPNQSNQTTKLTGRVALKSFYGPPNFGENPKTDSIETHYVLLTDQAFVFNTEATKELQIISLGQSLKLFTGKLVRLTGTPFLAETGHHFTPIVIELISIEAVR